MSYAPGTLELPCEVRSRGGRWILKWESMRRLGNFRLKTLPPEHPLYDDRRLAAHIPVDEGRLDSLLRSKAEVDQRVAAAEQRPQPVTSDDRSYLRPPAGHERKIRDGDVPGHSGATHGEGHR